jgi:alpha-1,2-mannosyltransferase
VCVRIPVEGALRVSLDAPARSRQRIVVQTAILVVLTAIAVLGHVYYGLRNQFFDLRVYRDAMLWWNSGQPLYEYIRPDETQGTLGFTYPPAGAFLLRPLAYLGLTTAVVAFIVLAVVCLAATCWWLSGSVARRHGWDRWFVACVVFLFTTGLMPIWFAFDFGQINFLLWALIVFDLAVLAPRHSRFLGVGIGLATAIKLVPGIFILYLLVSGRRRATIVAAATAAVATLIAWAAAPGDSTAYWTQRLLNGDGVGQLFYVMNQSLNGAVARLVQPETPSRWVWLLLALPVLVYGMWRARRAALAGDELTGMALAGFVGSLISPLTWSHHIFWFAPALLAMIDTAASPSSAVLSERSRPGASAHPRTAALLERFSGSRGGASAHPRTVMAAVRSGLRNRWALVAVSALVLGTVTFDTLGYYEYSMGHPGGWTSVVLGNWMIWLMLVLIIVLPVDPARSAADAAAAPGGVRSAGAVPVISRP